MKYSRTALTRILSAFQTVATPTLEVESHTLPTHLRLKQRAQTVITRLSTLPRSHLIHNVISGAHTRNFHERPNPRFSLARMMRTMNLQRLTALETFDPKPLASWRTPVFQDIDIEPDREREINKASNLEATEEIMVSSDTSGRHLGMDQPVNITPNPGGTDGKLGGARRRAYWYISHK